MIGHSITLLLSFVHTIVSWLTKESKKTVENQQSKKDLNSQKKRRRSIRKLIIHFTNSPDSQDVGIKEITQWHKARGWLTIGYHYVIKRNGRLERGRPEILTGAHVKGYNQDSIGICWVGREAITKTQTQSLYICLEALCKKYNLPASAVYGHYEFNSKKICPNLNMEEVRERLGKRLYGGKEAKEREEESK